MVHGQSGTVTGQLSIDHNCSTVLITQSAVVHGQSGTVTGPDCPWAVVLCVNNTVVLWSMDSQELLQVLTVNGPL